jgi:hypothetical protein
VPEKNLPEKNLPEKNLPEKNLPRNQRMDGCHEAEGAQTAFFLAGSES